jgi:hypothetical protein
LIADVSLLGAKARIQAHIKNQQSGINNHKSKSGTIVGAKYLASLGAK